MGIAFTTGLVGSLHCLGMCGPLFVAVMHRSPQRNPWDPVVYHSGRIFTYILLGVLLGALGQGVSLLGWQKSLSIAMGVGIILAQFRLAKFNLPAFKASSLLKRTWNLHQRQSSLASKFMMGIANGILPCGLVYLALATSLTQSLLWESVGFMLFFGLGTLPAWAICSWGLHSFPGINVKKLLTAFSVLLGIILILRGMELGIPMLSPQYPVVLSEGIPLCE